MKLWALLTVALYLLVLTALMLPILLLCGLAWGGQADEANGLQSALSTYTHQGFWLWLAMMGIGQAIMLIVPVRLQERRLAARRSVAAPVVTASFFLSCLLLCGGLSLLLVLLKDKALDAFAWIGDLSVNDPSTTAAASLAEQLMPGLGKSAAAYVLGVLIIIGVFWILWGVLFYLAARRDEPKALSQRATKWLLRGSVLELLVAVPSHIIVRHRGDCCAPVGTFWGITTGISVMLMCFGPGVFFLFVKRFRNLRPGPASIDAAITGR
jgi:hypothetical protein